MFYFSGFTFRLRGIITFCVKGFPHSDIAGSKVARHLPDAYRRHATSFIAIQCLGIHHTPLNTLRSNLLLLNSSILIRLKNPKLQFSKYNPLSAVLYSAKSGTPDDRQIMVLTPVLNFAFVISGQN